MVVHKVAQGECLLSIAEQYGFAWQTLWDHPDNAALKALRQDPNVLNPGDTIVVPERRLKAFERPTGAVHRFSKTLNKARMKVRITIGDQPLAAAACRVCVDDLWTDLATDADGFIEMPISPRAQQGWLVFAVGAHELRLPVAFGVLDPLDEPSGVLSRLAQLGFDTARDGVDAIRGFRHKAGLPASDAVDGGFRAALRQAHGH